MKAETTRRCPACNGTGYNPGDHDCAECNGVGKLSQKEYESLIPSAKSQTTREAAINVDRLADNLKCRLQAIRDDLNVRIEQIIDIQLELKEAIRNEN